MRDLTKYPAMNFYGGSTTSYAYVKHNAERTEFWGSIHVTNKGIILSEDKAHFKQDIPPGSEFIKLSQFIESSPMLKEQGLDPAELICTFQQNDYCITINFFTPNVIEIPVEPLLTYSQK